MPSSCSGRERQHFRGKLAALAAVCFVAGLHWAAAEVISDNFDDGSINGALWDTILGGINSTAVETGGSLQMQSGGWLKTKAQFPAAGGPLTVTGQFTLGNATEDRFYIVSRWDGLEQDVAFASRGSAPLNGLEIDFRPRTAPVPDPNGEAFFTVFASDDGTGVGSNFDLVAAGLSFEAGGTYNFSFSDDGFNFSITVTHVSGPGSGSVILAGSTPFSSGSNYVGFHNYSMVGGVPPQTTLNIEQVTVDSAAPTPPPDATIVAIDVDSDVAVEFNSEDRVTYELESATDAMSAYLPLGVRTVGTGSMMQLLDTAALPSTAMYRLNLTVYDERPSVLVCSPQGTSRPHVDLDWLEDLFAEGFEPDYLDHHQDFNWTRISQYNVLILYGAPEADGGSNIAFPTSGPRLAEYTTLVENFLAAGGGVFMMVHTDNGDVHTRPLIEPWGARLPLEWYAESDPAKIVPFPRMRTAQEAMVLVDQVLASPISTGSEKLWLPYGLGGADNSSWTGPISVDANWQVVVKGSATSYTDPLDDDPFTNLPIPPGALIRPGGVTEPDLLALRQYGNGRIVLCAQWPGFTIGQGTKWIYNRHCLSRGINGIPSNFEEIVLNGLRWLAEPSMAGGGVGGYTANVARFDPPNLDPVVEADLAPKIWQTQDLDMSQPSAGGQGFVGLIGARTTRTGGTGSVLDYANAARAVGLDFLIFLERFADLTQAELASLGTECQTHSDSTLLLIPGYTIDVNTGNHMFFTGHNLPWPTPIALTGPSNTLLNLQFQDTNGVYGVNDATFDWILSDHDRYNGQMVGFFDFDDSRAMQMPDLKICSVGAIRTYIDGVFIEDKTQGFLDSAEGTMTQLPLSVNLVDSPAELTAEVLSGNALIHARATSMDRLPLETLRWNSQYDAPRAYASDGPVVEAWTKTLRSYNYGAEPFVVNADLAVADLNVSAGAGLQEIKVWNGRRLFRRFLPGGASSYRQILQVPAHVQQNLVLDVTDTQGGKAVTYPLRTWKEGSMSVVFCGDHVNDCGRQYLARGTGIVQTHRYPLFDAGLTWDGGPRGERPIVNLYRNSPWLNSSLGQEGSDGFHNIPVMEFADEQAIVIRSTLDEVYDPNIPHINPWHTYGPKDPSQLLRATRRYTEFNRPLLGVRGTGWGAIGDRTGATICNFENDITFKQVQTINQLVLLQSNWTASQPNTFLVLGRTTIVERDLDASTTGTSDVIRSGEWFGMYSTDAYNSFLFLNRGEDVRVNVVYSGGSYLVQVVGDLQGQSVAAGEEKHYEFFSINDPLDVSTVGQPRFLGILDYLDQPEGIQVLQGTRLTTLGFFDVETPSNNVPVELLLPRPTEPMQLTLPVRVHGLNANWSAGLYQRKGHTTGYYTDGEDEYTTLGFDFDSRVYAALYPDQVPETHVLVGHPIVCDRTELIIEVMPRADAGGNYTWHVAVNNPTDNPINATFRQGMTVRGLNFATQAHTIAAGGYVVLRL